MPNPRLLRRGAKSIKLSGFSHDLLVVKLKPLKKHNCY